MAKESQQSQSLSEFMRAKAKQKCAVCKLPVSIRAQLGRPASEQGFTRPEQVEWLLACGYKDVDLDILNKHLSARHDREEDLQHG